MKRSRLRRHALTVLLLAALPVAAQKFRSASQRGVPDTYTVVLSRGVARGPFDSTSKLPSVPEVAKALAQRHGGTVGEVWEYALQGFLIRMPEAKARRLARDKRVQSVEQDFWIPQSEQIASNGALDCYVDKVHVVDTHNGLPSNTAPQSIDCSDPNPEATTSTPCIDNWGLDRIDQPGPARDGLYSFANNGRSPQTTVHVYVFDSGVLGTHQDFATRA